MDNLKAHKVEGVEEMIEAVGARIVYLSPYSPEFNPIEHYGGELRHGSGDLYPRSIQIVEKLLDWE
jgi:putative transposase